MIYLNSESKIPIYQQIYSQLKDAITNGTLKGGDKLPSIRLLATNLCVARNTVENAYYQLCLEGYVFSKHGSGFIVQNISDDLLLNPNINLIKPPSDYLSDKKIEAKASSNIHESISLGKDKSVVYKYDFQYGGLSNNYFPYSLWRRLTMEALQSFDTQEVNLYNDNPGESGLRIEIMKYLQKSRGVFCAPEQIILCCGTQYALELICKLIPAKDRIIAMEEPGYDGARIVFENNDFEIMPIKVNAEGISIEELELSPAKLAYITPSHQFPTGAVMPIQNRMRLLDWASQNECLIFEDDYDSEFRYDARPIPSLQSIDNNGRVIYLGTFSKTLSPKLRMSYMVLPPWLLLKYHELFDNYYSTVPWLQQRTTGLYMAGGHWEKHLKRICIANKKKCDILVQTVTQLMHDKVVINGKNAGLHVILEFVNGEEQNWLIEKAKEYKVKVYSTRPFWYRKENCQKNMILLGYSMLDEKEIVAGITLLNKAWFGQ